MEMHLREVVVALHGASALGRPPTSIPMRRKAGTHPATICATHNCPCAAYAAQNATRRLAVLCRRNWSVQPSSGHSLDDVLRGNNNPVSLCTAGPARWLHIPVQNLIYVLQPFDTRCATGHNRYRVTASA